jgi:hypothetical protein
MILSIENMPSSLKTTLKPAITAFFILGLFLSAIISPTVNATSVTYDVDFEDGIVGNTYTYPGVFHTVEKTGWNNISGSTPRSGLKCLDYGANASGLLCWMNFTYSMSNYLIGLDLKIRFPSAGGDYPSLFMNLTNKTSGIVIFAIRFKGNSNNWVQAASQESDGSWDNFGTQQYEGFYKSVFINFTANDTAYLYQNVTGETALARASGPTDFRIDSIRFYGSFVGTDFKFDDLNFTVSDSYTGEAGELLYCGNDMSDYTQIGNIFGEFTIQQVNAPELMIYYNVPRTTTVHGVALHCGPDQYNDPVLANYACTVNGQSLGSPDCFSQASNGYDYILFWPCDLVVEDEPLTFIFNHNAVLSGSSADRYWMVARGSSGVDLDGDGDAEFGYNNQFQDCGWVWFIFAPFWVCSGYTAQTVSADLAYSFWVDELEPTWEFSYNDTIGLHLWDEENDTGYIYGQATPMTVSYTLSTAAYDYTIAVTQNGSAYETLNAPYPGSSLGFLPPGPGVYRFTLQSTHPVANVTGYVLDGLPDNIVLTDPPISDQFDPYNVIYNYHHAQGQAGDVAMFDYLEDVEDDFSAATESWEIAANTTDYFPFYSYTDSAEYWVLYTRNGNNRVQFAPVHTHYIRIPGVISNTINVQWNDWYQLPEGNPDHITARIYGSHLYPGTDIAVYVRGLYAGSVGGDQLYSLFFEPSEPGLYTCELKVTMNGTLVTLASTSFVVASAGGPGVGGLTVYDFIPAGWAFYVGIAVVIGLALAPAAAIYTMMNELKKSGITIEIKGEWLVYLSFFTGTTGYVLCLWLGLFEWWTVFVAVFLLVLGCVFLYLAKKQGA